MVRRDPRERFLAFVDKGEGCWPWTGSITRKGYGRFNLKGRMEPAHRVAYLLFVGAIPAGLQIDHACHTADRSCPGGDSCLHRRCVNPAHLRPVTSAENTATGRTIAAMNAAKTHCKHGHEFTPENTYRISNKHGGGRACRTCIRAAARRYQARKKGALVK